MFPLWRRYLKRQPKLSTLVVLLLVLTLAFNEGLIYYLTLAQCSWPVISESSSLRTMVLADTHLLGPFRGHWFDKLRREWQMHRAFVTAVTLHKPDHVIFLGDIFDEGMWVDEQAFADYVQRFHSVFPALEGRPHHVVVGNHDIGFHYAISPDKVRMFEESFGKQSVSWDTIRNVHFLSINSMAMEGDDCGLCTTAQKRLKTISGDIQCLRNDCKRNVSYLKPYSSAVLLQHFPMYRKSDSSCAGEDAASAEEKLLTFKEKWDCLSKESSDLLISEFQPRLVLSAHTHDGCEYKHGNMSEISVPSFSWRNRNNPSFLMATFGQSDFKIDKCMLPMESTVIRIYVCLAVFNIVVFIVYLCNILFGRKSYNKST